MRIQQRLSGAPDDLHGPTLLAVQAALEEYVRHAEDPVHGGSDLVTHFRQELGFRPVGGFRGLLGLDEFVRPAGHLGFEFLPVVQELFIPGLDVAEHFVEPLNQLPDLVVAVLVAVQAEVLFPRHGLHRAGQLREGTGDRGGEPSGEQVRPAEGADQDQAGEKEVPLHAAPELVEGGPKDHGADPLSIDPDGRHRVNGAEIPGVVFPAERFQHLGVQLPASGDEPDREGKIPRDRHRGDVCGQDLVVAREQVGGEDRFVAAEPRERLVRHFRVLEHDCGDAVVADHGRGRFQRLPGIRPEGQPLVDHEHDRGTGQDEPAGQQDDRHELLLDGGVPERPDHLSSPSRPRTRLPR